MDRVIDRLWIGSARDISSPLQALGFSAVLDLRDGASASAEGVEVQRIQNRDGDPWMKEQVEDGLVFIHKWIRSGKVLVACQAGLSRSASFVIAYLVRCGHDPASAYALVRAARPQITPVRAMIESALAVVV